MYMARKFFIDASNAGNRSTKIDPSYPLPACERGGRARLQGRRRSLETDMRLRQSRPPDDGVRRAARAARLAIQCSRALSHSSTQSERALQQPELLLALPQRAQSERVEPDEAGGVAMVVGDSAFLEGDEV